MKNLARELGVTRVALRRLGVGWSQKKKAYTFPERDGKGNCIGLTYRFRDGTKRSIRGGQRGLCISDGHADTTGPILIPEGGSDVAAAISAGLCAVGRPSATGGLDHLAELLKTVDADREIIVLAEMDPKVDGRWPGKEAAEKMAYDLGTRLGRRVGWMLPPEGKDLREFICARPEGVKLRGRGAELVEAVKTRAIWIEPATDEFEIKVERANDLLRREIPLEWLVEGLFLRGQPIVVGAAKKSLKTMICLDLAISLSAGQPFLGHAAFKIDEPQRVLMISGESGDAVIKRNIRTQASAKGGKCGRLAKDLVANLLLAFKLPRLSDPRSLAVLERHLAGGLDVLIIDPLYLCLLAGNTETQAANLFHMGPLLYQIGAMCARHGVTLILVHHFPKRKPVTRDLPELDDLAFAGCAEFARQWLLLSRREKFVLGSGLHKLWMVSGNSAGASGAWGLDIDEGKFDPTSLEGGCWNASVKPHAEAQNELNQAREDLKSVKAEVDVQTVYQYLSGHAQGDTQSGIVQATAIGKPRVKAAIERLVFERKIKSAEVPKSGGAGGRIKLYDGYCATRTMGDAAANPVTKPAKPKKRLKLAASAKNRRAAVSPAADTAG